MRHFAYSSPIIMVCSFIIIASSTAQNKPDQLVKSADLNAQISYALGLDIVEQLKRTMSLDVTFFIEGVQDAMEDTGQLSEDELNHLLQAYQRTSRNRQIEKIKQEFEKNQLAGDAWLLENSIKQGVVTLSSGLQYKVLKNGTGKNPAVSDRVKCHYRGMLIDGTIFDSSYDRGEPAVFEIKDVIKGWQIVLPKMKEGSRWMLYIPADMAYEDRGAGDVIKPGMTLVFEVELLQILE